MVNKHNWPFWETHLSHFERHHGQQNRALLARCKGRANRELTARSHSLCCGSLPQKALSRTVGRVGVGGGTRESPGIHPACGLLPPTVPLSLNRGL